MTISFKIFWLRNKVIGELLSFLENEPLPITHYPIQQEK
jgi:hypothetical protein